MKWQYGEESELAKLSNHEFYVGAGLVALLENNERLFPTYIDGTNKNSVNTEKTIRRGKGEFYCLQTKKGNVFTVYIKYTDDFQKNTQMKDDHMWKFNLTAAEKEKIQNQYKECDTLFVILVCKKDETINKTLESQVVLLTWEDYCAISERSTIQVGIWKDEINQKKRQHYYAIKIGKGLKGKENYLHVKMNKIGRTLDEYVLEENADEDKKERVKLSEKDKRDIIFVKDNVGWCADCQRRTVTHEVSISDNEKVVLNICPSCQKKYMKIKEYMNLSDREIDNAKYVFRILRSVVSRVNITNTNKTICPRCGEEFLVQNVGLKIYKDLMRDNAVERIESEDLFYCKNCQEYYITPQIWGKFKKKYGDNKINCK